MTRQTTRARMFAAGAALAVFLLGAFPALGAAGDTTWTLAGTGVAADSGDGGQAREADINRPRSIFTTAAGGYVWAEPWSNRVRITGPDGVIATLAGTGASGFGGDGGQAAAAKLNFVHSAAPTSDGGYLLADTQNNRIRKISAAGIITTVAGTGSAGYSGDNGAATSAKINNPRGVAALPDGGFLIPDTNNHRVRKVSAAGVITTVAGTGVQGFSGDGGPATVAKLSIAFGVAPTADGGFLLIDAGSQRIRKVGVDGIIDTVAGTGSTGYSGDSGPATSAQLYNPHNLAALADGGFLIADASNERIRLVAADGTISTLIGDGIRGYSGDGGPAAAARISVPKAVGVSPSGDVLIADEQNNRIRFVGSVVAPVNTAPPIVAGTAREGQTLSAAAGGWSGTGPLISYQWQRCEPACADIPGASARAYVPVAADVGRTLRVGVTGSNPEGSPTAYSSETSVVTAPLVPPTNTSPPAISGTPQEGQTLTANDGTWAGTTPLAYAYQWLRCDASGGACAAIAGASAKTYVVPSADVGSTLRVAVTASNGGSVYATAVSAGAPRSYWRFGEASGPLVDQQGVANGIYVGSPQYGVPGLLTGDPDTAVSFNGTSQYAEAPGAAAWTPAAFSIEIVVRPSVLPVNKTIWATQGSFTGWWLNTGPSGEARIFVGDGSAWRFTGTGPVLAAGGSHHLVVTYDGANARLYLNGALASTGPTTTMSPNGGANVMRFGAFSTGPGQYWPGTLDEASFYPAVLTPSQVQAHYNASITGSLATSAATALVTGSAPVNTSPPVVSGAAQVGQTLSATAGNWSGTAPISYAYQWRRCDGSGAACSDLSGATGPTYAVVADDLASTLRVAVTASNSAGQATAESAATAVVTSAPSSVTYVASAWQPFSSSTIFSIPAPSGSGAGDLLLAWVVTDTAHTIAAAPTGWTQVGSTQADGTDSSLSVFSRLLQAGDPSSWTGSFPSVEAGIVGVVGYRGADPTTPIELIGQRSAGYSSTSTTATIAPGGNGRLLVTLYGADPGTGSRSGTPDTNPAATERIDVGNGTLGYVYAQDHLQTTAAPISLDVTWNGGESSANFILALSATAGAPSAPVNSSPPVVSGTAQQGQTLTATTGIWSGTAPISFTYRWQRCNPDCVDVAGATASSYPVVAADVGASLRVGVTGTNSVGSSEAFSAQTATVIAAGGGGTLTVSIGAGGDDGDVTVAGAQAGGYPPSGSPIANSTGSFVTAGRRLAFGEYEILTALLRFDTSALPDNATITSAKLRIHVTAKADANDRSLVGEWYDPAAWPIDPADWALTVGTSALPGTDLTGLTKNTTADLILSTPGSVSLTGTTGLRLGISGDQPTGDNLVQLAALEHPSKPEPQLLITYTTP
ncbi:MAG: hypothetical protein MSC30_05260 [Gaiellaceae bacterium MAG52_C11]|nr:hypothetical protein [Candidatus Gaiellasilicea maunaloa]